MKAIDQAGEAVRRLCGPGYTQFLASHHKTAWEESPLVPMRKQAYESYRLFSSSKNAYTLVGFTFREIHPLCSSLISLRNKLIPY